MTDDLIKRIDDNLGKINLHWQDPETLSAINMALARDYVALGDLVTEAELNADKSKAHYDHMVQQRKLELVKKGDSATVAESKAEVEYHNTLMANLENKYNYNLLKRRREGLDKEIETVRSRVSLIKGDIPKVAMQEAI